MRKSQYIALKGYLMPIIITLITTIITVVGFYSYIYNYQYKNIVRLSYEVLKTNSNLIETELTGIDRFVNAMSSTASNLEFIKSKGNTMEWLNYQKEITNNLAIFCNSSSVVVDAMIISPKADVGISKNASTTLDYFYKSCFNLPENKAEYDKIFSTKETINIFPSNIYKSNTYKNEKVEESLIYSKSISADTKIIVVINSQELKKVLMPAEDISEYVAIKNNKNETLVDVSSKDAKKGLVYEFPDFKDKNGSCKISTKDGRRTVFYQKSLLNSWVYITVFNNKISHNTSLLFVLALVVWFVIYGGFLAVLLWKNSRKNIKSLEKIYDKGLLNSAGGLYEGLSNGVELLFTENDLLLEKLKLNNQELVSNFLLRVMMSDINSELQIENMLNFLQLDFKGQFYGVVLIESSDDNEKGDIANFKKICNDIFLYNNFFVLTANIRVVVVNFNEPEILHETLREKITEGNEEILDDYIFYVSNYFNSLTGISKAYAQVKEMKSFQNYKLNKGFLIYDEDLFRFDVTVWFLEKEKSSMQADVLKGDVVGIKADFKKLLTKVIFTNELNIVAMKYFLHDVLSFTARVVVELPYEHQEILDRVNQAFTNVGNQNEVEILQYVKDELVYITERMAEYLSLPHNSTFDVIVAEIMNNYANPDLNVNDIADKLGYSVTYISEEFKKNNDSTLAKFIEETRITKAKDLIVNSELEITDIATKVGYNSLVSFGRAFKKKIGMSPTEYKKNVK